MAFFARPNLDNTQFKQLEGGEPLTLSGQTQIATISGLTLADGSGNTIVINAEGASVVGQVLTYDGIGTISLCSPSSGASTGIYTCASPTTCAVGGLSACSNITGCTIAKILEMILVPTLNPTLTSPSLSTFALTPSTTIYEAGCSISITGTSCFSAGCINPQYSAICDKRVCAPTCYVYGCCGVVPAITHINPAISDSVLFGSLTINSGSTTLSAVVYHTDGVQPKYSDGTDYLSGFSSGCTNTITKTLCGVLPWYYGTKKLTNVISKTDVTGGTKGAISTLPFNILPITYNSASDDYLWFAVPQGTAAKTSWFVCASNQGVIGGTNNLFASACIVTGVTSTFGCVSSYSVYASCITTGTASGVPMCMS